MGFANSRPPTAFNRFTNHTIDTTSSGSNSLDDDADMSSIRALNERFRFITAELPPAPAFHALPTVAQKLAQLNRQRTEPSSNHEPNSLDFEQTSETESCYQNHCIDEETYNVPEEKPAIVKPKIVKPTALAAKSVEDVGHELNEPEVKTVRGKKKAAYVSPYRKTTSTSPPCKKAIVTTTTTPSPPKRAISKLVTPRTSPANNIVTKTHVLTNKSSLTTKSGLARPGFSGSPKAATPKTPLKGSCSPKKLTPPSPPERQGTFVKDEPTHVDAPVVVLTSAPSSPAKTSRIPSKLPSSIASSSPAKSQSPSSIARLKNPLQRSATVSNTRISPKASARPTLPGTPTTDVKRRQNTPSGIGFFRSPSTPSVPMRSHSNASLKSTGTTPTSSQPPSRSNSNLSKTGSIITSRIAGLWKKQQQPDPKTVAKNSTVVVAAAAAAKPPRLIRSSTFNNTPEEEAAPEVIKMRGHPVDSDPSKRISRLGTFINVDETSA